MDVIKCPINMHLVCWIETELCDSTKYDGAKPVNSFIDAMDKKNTRRTKGTTLFATLERTAAQL